MHTGQGCRVCIQLCCMAEYIRYSCIYIRMAKQGESDKNCNFINLALWLSEGGTARYKCSGTVILNHGLKEERISESNEQFKGKETQ